jgi:hypothetical protein
MKKKKKNDLIIATFDITERAIPDLTHAKA